MEEVKQETPIPEAKSEIQKNTERLAELRASNDALEAEQLRGEQLRAARIMGGRSEVMPMVKPKTQEELDKEEAENFAKKLFGR